MDKQKQIEEMAKTLCANCRKDGYSCSLYSSDDDWVCVQERERAETFYNAGYRKESETVKEVLQKVKSYTLDNEVGMKYLLQRLGKEYGVEV